VYSLARGKAVTAPEVDPGETSTVNIPSGGRGHGSQSARSNKVPGSARIKMDHSQEDDSGHKTPHSSRTVDVEGDKGGPKRYSASRGGQEGAGKEQMFQGFPVVMMMPQGQGQTGHHGNTNPTPQANPPNSQLDPSKVQGEYPPQKPLLLPPPDPALLPPNFQQPMQYVYSAMPGFPMGEMEEGYGHYQGGLFIPNMLPPDQRMMMSPHQGVSPMQTPPQQKARSHAIPIVPPQE
jgi:hypothetical protein